MDCCQCQAIESLFDRKKADQELKQYRRSGPRKTTRILLDALMAEDIEGMTLLDIGGGIGVVQHELLTAGAKSATNVDAATAYIAVAKEEAERRGHADRVSHHYGNFVDLAPGIPPADIVTLDRVICCYHDMRSLVGLSAERAQKLYGVVYPRDTWWMKAGMRVMNLMMWTFRSPFRGFVHPTASVEAIVRQAGFTRRFHHAGFIWQVAVYGR